MPPVFSADEVFRIACQIEANGERFYREAARRASDPEIAAAFTDLAAMEASHARTFEALLGATVHGGRPGADAFVDPDGEAAAHLREIANRHVFATDLDPAAIFAGVTTAEGLVRVALIFEHDSVAYFRGVMAHVPADLGRATIAHLVEEELEHIALLERIRPR